MKNKFASKLRELREEAGLSQLQLGKNLNVTQAGVAKWEAGTREPSLDVLILVSRYFDVTTDYMLGLED